MGPFHSVNVYQAFSLFCFYCSFDFCCLKYSPLTVFPWSQTQMSPMFEAFFNCLFTLNSWALHSPFTKILYHLLYTGWFNTRLKNSSCAISLKSPSLRVGLFLFIFVFFLQCIESTGSSRKYYVQFKNHSSISSFAASYWTPAHTENRSHISLANNLRFAFSMSPALMELWQNVWLFDGFRMNLLIAFQIIHLTWL